MTKVVLSPFARTDMQEIADHISRELRNPQAARNILRQFRETIAPLDTFPEMGTPLVLTGKQIVPYRYLVSGNYLIFYHITQDAVNIDRILYGRRDYMALLFGDVFTEEA